jgi:hypothetical protein
VEGLERLERTDPHDERSEAVEHFERLERAGPHKLMPGQVFLIARILLNPVQY